MKSRRISITDRVVHAATCPCTRHNTIVWDSGVPGLGLRVLSTGHKSWIVRYRTEHRRGAPQRQLSIGDASEMSIKAARTMARAYLGKVADGRDPSAERRQEKERDKVTLATVLERYDSVLARREIVQRKQAISALRRGIVEPIGPMTRIDRLTRAMVVEQIEAAELRGRGKGGAAEYLRQQARSWLGWACDVGLIAVNPLAGLRRPKATRAQQIEAEEIEARALDDAEIAIVWRAAEAVGPPFGAYIQLLLLTGARKQELVGARWGELDGDALMLPACRAKTGRMHRVALSRLAQRIIGGLPRKGRLILQGRGARPMTGVAQRLERMRQAHLQGQQRWTLHDLRRTFRSGLSRLGIDPIVAELLLSHRIRDDLQATYDRHDYWPQRIDAVNRWADHIQGIIDGETSNIVPLRRASRSTGTDG